MTAELIRRGERLLKLKATQDGLKNTIPLKVFNVKSLKEEKEIKATDWPQYNCVIIVRVYEYESSRS